MSDVESASQSSPAPSLTKSHASDQELSLLQTLWKERDWHKYRDRAEDPDFEEPFFMDESDAVTWAEGEADRWYAKEEERSRLEELQRDWSQSERGSHVDFAAGEDVPLRQETYLGRGAMGDVYQTEVMGYKLAWKRITLRRQVMQKDLKEIEILKKLSHAHMITLIGTYTHRQCLGLLLKPVAVCDLHTFFDDVEAYWSSRSSPLQNERLSRLSFCGSSSAVRKACPAYFQIGCLVSAVAYLHEQKVRHKDLKPSNILMAADGLYLSDFGSATDFSLLSQSATDNERGTPKYFAPEVAEWEPNGRAADMFSLGCILLEIFVLNREGTLSRLRTHRSLKNTAYHANLDQLDNWIPLREDVSPLNYHLIGEIRDMLSRNPKRRPTAEKLLHRLVYADKLSDSVDTTYSIFGSCCRTTFMRRSEHYEAIEALETSYNAKIEEAEKRIRGAVERVYQAKKAAGKAEEELEQRTKDMKTRHQNDMARLKALYESLDDGKIRHVEKVAEDKMKEMEKDHEHNIKRVKAIYEAFFVNANGASEGMNHLGMEAMGLRDKLVTRRIEPVERSIAIPQTIVPRRKAARLSIGDACPAGDENTTALLSTRPTIRRNKSAPSILPTAAANKALLKQPPLIIPVIPRSYPTVVKPGKRNLGMVSLPPSPKPLAPQYGRNPENILKTRNGRFEKIAQPEMLATGGKTREVRDTTKWQRLKSMLGPR